MILFEKIRWKNFLSTGNQFTEMTFNENQTTLIIGNNGSGKSTVLDALTFSLFGKPFRKINKPLLVNSVNEKECRVEVEFSVGSINWKVIRGIKPNVFEIWRNDSLLDQSAAALDQQKWLEQNVLKMNYKSFTQIVILGSSTFVPFMQLSASNRREVIEDLLDIKIFSSMSGIIKEKIRQTKDDIKVLQLKKESLTDKVQMQKNFIEELESRAAEDIKSKETNIMGLLDEENKFMHENIKIVEELDDLNIEDNGWSKSWVNGEDAFEDGNGHGTHVAGTIAAKVDGKGVIGVAPGALITSLKVFNSCLLYTSPSPRDMRRSRMPSSA